MRVALEPANAGFVFRFSFTSGVPVGVADRPFTDFRTGPSQGTVVAPAISSATRTQKLSFNTRTSPRAINRPLT